MHYKKGQQLETAREARRFMVAHPGCRVETDKGLLFKWSANEAHFVHLVLGRWEPITPNAVDAPFTIIDEPVVSAKNAQSTERLDLQTGEVRAVEKQPEWVPTIKKKHWFNIDEVVAWSNSSLPEKLELIYRNAQKVRAEAPSWSAMDNFECYLPLTEAHEMRLNYALQIGATVKYLPKKEGV